MIPCPFTQPIMMTLMMTRVFFFFFFEVILFGIIFFVFYCHKKFFLFNLCLYFNYVTFQTNFSLVTNRLQYVALSPFAICLLYFLLFFVLNLYSFELYYKNKRKENH